MCTNNNQCNDANSQCLTPYTDCTEGVCTCEPNFYGDNRCLVGKHIQIIVQHIQSKQFHNRAVNYAIFVKRYIH